MCIKHKNKKMLAIQVFLEDGTYFKDIITIFIEGYIDLLIASYFNLLCPLYDYSGEIFGVYFSYFALSICIVIIPSLTLWIAF